MKKKGIKTSDKRRAKRIKRENIKRAMNKKVFFTLTGCPKKLQGLSNRYNYKSNMHNLIYKDAKFQNVRYQASIITNCNFNQTVLTGVDFCNCNLNLFAVDENNSVLYLKLACADRQNDMLIAVFDAKAVEIGSFA